MLSRSGFSSRFAARALFGVVHLRPLPGAPLFTSMTEVVDAAIADARAIEQGGCDGVVVENFGDRPFTRGRVEPETVAAMARIVGDLAREVRLPVGVNVLRNDALSALAIAAATGALFVRVNVHTGAMLTDQGIIEGDAYATMRKRAAIAPDVLLFADHLVKHAAPLAPLDPSQVAKDLRLRGLADALIITGSETGAAADPAQLAVLREAVDAPLLIGSGMTLENAAGFRDADGAIVGTAIKRQGRIEEAVDADRVARLVERFKS